MSCWQWQLSVAAIELKKQSGKACFWLAVPQISTSFSPGFLVFIPLGLGWGQASYWWVHSSAECLTPWHLECSLVLASFLLLLVSLLCLQAVDTATHLHSGHLFPNSVAVPYARWHHQARGPELRSRDPPPPEAEYSCVCHPSTSREKTGRRILRGCWVGLSFETVLLLWTPGLLSLLPMQCRNAGIVDACCGTYSMWVLGTWTHVLMLVYQIKASS